MTKSTTALRAVLWSLATFCLCFVGVLGVWLAFPTTTFLRPVVLSYAYTGEELCGSVVSDTGWCATFERETPLGSATANWATEIRVIGRSGIASDCGLTGGPTQYQIAPGNVINYPVSPRLVSCIESGLPVTVVQRHWALWGPFKLRPVELRGAAVAGDHREIIIAAE